MPRNNGRQRRLQRRLGALERLRAHIRATELGEVLPRRCRENKAAGLADMNQERRNLEDNIDASPR